MTNVYDVGDQAVLSTTVTVNGTPTDATVVLAVTAPDGTASSPSVTHSGTGTYTATVPVTQAGLWLYVWTSAGAAVGVDQGQFTARPTGLRIVSLGEAKTHLNKAGAATSDDEELRGFVDAAGAVIRELAGPVLPETVVERHDGGYPQLLLRMPPVLTVTSIVETYAGVNNTLTLVADLGVGAVSGYDFTFEGAAGLITRRSYGNATRFFPGTRNIKITYQAGRSTVPWNIRLATLELIAHLWRSSQLGRGGNRPGSGHHTAVSGEDVLVTAFGYAVPNRVVELLGSDKRPAVMSR